MKEIKVAPKFKTIFLSKTIPDLKVTSRLRYWCKKFLQKGLMPLYGGGTLGNMSCRVGKDGFIITASATRDPLKAVNFVLVSRVDPRRKIVYAHGRRLPSSETMMHYLLYKKLSRINAVFHGHCEEILKEHAKLGLPSTDRHEAYGTLALAKSVIRAIDGHSFLVMKGHGFISIGKSMDSAGKNALKVLKTLRSIPPKTA